MRYSYWAALASAAALAGCGGAADRRIAIDFWAMGAEGERVQPLITDFEQTHPEIRVRVQQIPWSAAHEKLLTAFAGDALPDVCQLGNTWLAEYAALDALEDLTDRVATSAKVDPDDFFAGVWQGNVIDGRVVGVPWYVDTRILFYRTDLLAAAGHDKPPATWDEWMEVMRDVQAQQPTETFTLAAPGRGASQPTITAATRDRYAILLPTNEFEQPIILGMQAGAEMLRDGGRFGDFASDEFRRAFEFYVNIFAEGLAPKLANTRISNVWQEFERGTFAMYISGPWNVHEFRRRMSPAMRGRWTTAPWPSPTGDGPGVSNAGGCSLVVFRASQQEEAAWKLVEFLSRSDAQERFYELASSLPARRDAWEATGLANDPEFAAFHAQLTNVRPMPPTPEWEEIVTGELVKTAEAVINGRISVEAGLEQLDRRVDRILEKRRWMLARQTPRISP
jgi:multiple sugar transport system substrate-binding protein